MKKHVETERLTLRTLDSKDGWLIVDFYRGNMDFLREWETDRTSDYYTLKYQQELLEKEQIIMDHGVSLRLWIFKKGEPDKTIGCIAFDNIVMGPFKSCYMGYKMDKDELNNGFITEAARKGIEIMFKEYGLHRIEANIMPRNSRSLRVAEKLGFHSEGLALKYLKINGKWEDHIHMALINEDLEEQEE